MLTVKDIEHKTQCLLYLKCNSTWFTYWTTKRCGRIHQHCYHTTLLFISEIVAQLIKQNLKTRHFKRLADRCQQAEGRSFRGNTAQEMKHKFLRFRKSKTNEISNCKQYVLTHLGLKHLKHFSVYSL